jgi:hypothetical protein
VTSKELGDDGTNDLAVSDVLRTNDLYLWFLKRAFGGRAAYQNSVDVIGRL